MLILGLSLFLGSIAQANDLLDNPCASILNECMDHGYVEDQVAEPGRQIWLDCANPIIDRNQRVRGINIEPGRLRLCREYKQSKNFATDLE